MGRAFTPFAAPEATPRTQDTILEPTTSDTEVRADRPISIVVRIEGRVPGPRGSNAPMLRYRHDPAEDFLVLPLKIAGDGTWTLSFPADKIRGGFSLHTITAGDAITPEQRVRVRAKTFVCKIHGQPRTETIPIGERAPSFFPTNKGKLTDCAGYAARQLS